MPEAEIELEDMSGRSEEDLNEEVEDLASESEEVFRDALSPEEFQQMARDVDTIRAFSEDLNLTIEGELAEDATDQPALSNDIPAQEDTSLQSIEQRVNELYERIGGRERDARRHQKLKFLAWLGGGVFALVGAGEGVLAIIMIIEYIQGNASKPEEIEGLTPEDEETIKRLIDSWNSLPDTKFWEQMAHYYEKWVPSLEAQCLFMNYTQQVSSNPQPSVQWKNDEKSSLIADLVKTFETNSTPGDDAYQTIYRRVPQLQLSGGRAVPRQTAANLCQGALAEIDHRKRLQLGHA